MSEPGQMTMREASRLGNEKLLATRGRDHYAAMGRKGGAALVASRGRTYMRKIGRRGGKAKRKAEE